MASERWPVPNDACPLQHQLSLITPDLIALIRFSRGMASTRARGNEKERQAEKELIAQGYRTIRAQADIRWIPTPRGHPSYGKLRFIPISTRHDLYGVADIQATRVDETRLIQTTIDSPSTHGAHPSERRAKFVEKATQLDRTWRLEVWRWLPRRGWWIQRAVRNAAGAITDWEDLEKPSKVAVRARQPQIPQGNYYLPSRLLPELGLRCQRLT